MISRLIVTLLLTVLLITPSCILYAKEYRWKVTKVIDGDTLRVENDILPKELKLSVRILGVDTAEGKGKTKCSKDEIFAFKAKEFVINKIEDSEDIYFTNLKWGKYGGRVLADVYVDGESLAAALLDAGYAKPYHGGKKESWCD